MPRLRNTAIRQQRPYLLVLFGIETAEVPFVDHGCSSPGVQLIATALQPVPIASMHYAKRRPLRLEYVFVPQVRAARNTTGEKAVSEKFLPDPGLAEGCHSVRRQNHSYAMDRCL